MNYLKKQIEQKLQQKEVLIENEEKENSYTNIINEFLNIFTN